MWSAKTLNRKYDIDHSMPFARWPNNDLWNLVPSNSKVNNEKRDRLPTERKLVDARERMLRISVKTVSHFGFIRSLCNPLFLHIPFYPK